jgi:hypothetical protein
VTDRGALADDIEGALVNSEGKDFLMDAGFAREVIGALRAGQADRLPTKIDAALAEPAPIATVPNVSPTGGVVPTTSGELAAGHCLANAGKVIEEPSEAVRLAQEVIGNAKHMTEVDARLILAREVLQLRHEIEVLHHERVGPATSEADGYIVTLNDSASAPGGFWFVGAYHSREIAESLRSRTKASSVRPFRFTDARV